MRTIAMPISLIFLAFALPTLADEERTIIAEVRLSTNSYCIRNEINETQLEQALESDAHQKCDDEKVEHSLERIVPEIIRTTTCFPGGGGEIVFQSIYRCSPAHNPDVLFDRGSLNLQSLSNQRAIGLPFMASSCLFFKLTGLSYEEGLPTEKLETLRSHLAVYQNSGGNILASQVINKEGMVGIEYQRILFPRNSRLFIQTKSHPEGLSINDLLAKDLGKSERSGFKFGIEILPTECE